jgi:hypothetical protein
MEWLQLRSTDEGIEEKIELDTHSVDLDDGATSGRASPQVGITTHVVKHELLQVPNVEKVKNYFGFNPLNNFPCTLKV